MSARGVPAPSAPRVGVAVVAFQAEQTIERVLDQVPLDVLGSPPLILVADDASADSTARRAEAWAATRDGASVVVVRRPHNLGYGGNQKACYLWAIDRGLEVVVLLHGDEQYPAERIPALVAPILRGDADAVFGTRMATPGGAKRGGMPWVRRAGNRFLSVAANRVTGTSFSEWFCGFRAYRVSTLAEVDLDRQPDDFDFDVALTMALLARGARIEEVPIPTRYAGEISRVPLLRTGCRVAAHVVRSRLGGRPAPSVAVSRPPVARPPG